MFEFLTFFLLFLLILSITYHLLSFRKTKKSPKQDTLEYFELPFPNDFLNIIHNGDVRKMYQALVTISEDIFQSKASALYLFSPQKDHLICKERSTLLQLKKNQEKISMREEEHYLVRTVLDGKPYIIKEPLNDKRIKPKLLIFSSVSSLITYPLKLNNEIQGVLLMNFDQPLDQSIEKHLIKLEMISVLLLSLVSSMKEQKRLQNMHKDFKKAEEEYLLKIQRMQEQLVLSGKLSSLGALASGIAHEIRNPLTIIKMIVNELANEIEVSQSEDILVIKTEIDRMEEIVNQFLDFARPKELRKIPYNINRLIRETLNFLNIELENKNIIVQQNFYSTLPNIFCDHNQLKQVFVNIILNAINAIESIRQDNRLIEIATSIQLKKNQKVIKIIIADNGTGISNEIINSIFDPFITTRGQGVGLGLSISYRVIESHNGIIEANNRMGGGAKFNIYLPIED